MRERVQRQMQERIESGQMTLKTLQEWTEETLAREFDTSRTTVRNARTWLL